jgi:class 3 adenylate cyclase
VSERQICGRCGHENDPEQRFCGSCGAALFVSCPSCGAENPSSHAFCGRCGSELARVQRTGSGEERRVVTVVFADLVGFTSRAEQLDPEDVRGILSSYYARLREELEQFGGTVEKFIGDAVMAVFGAPVAHGDDPERAVRAALAIRQSVAAMNEADPTLDLQLRIAVNTGEAIVSLGTEAPRGEGMIAGDVVNTASRLQTAAPTNGVVVGEETYRATRTAIQYEELEPLELKGKQLPVRAWLALGVRDSAPERGGAPLVGRQSELSVLGGIWERSVREGRPHLVTMLAPAGTGKSRLTREFAATVESSGGRVVAGRSLPYGAPSAYLPFRHQVKDAAGIFETDPPDVATGKLRATVSSLLGDDHVEEVTQHLTLLIGLAPERDVENRQVLFFSARRFVEALARREPTVLVFEDIHWADSSLLDLLEHLAARVRDVPLVLLALARPELLDSRPTWGSRLPAYTSLPLEPLGEREAQELAARLLRTGANGSSAYDEAARLAETSGGNPLFIEELAASVAEGTTEASQSLPTNIRAIISARLDALQPEERSLVLDASVIGKLFWRRGLEYLGWSTEELSDVLDSLEARDLIRRHVRSRVEGDEEYSFKHGLIRDVAYATLPRAQRRERHAAFAKFVEESAGDRTAAAAFLAHHWREAGEDERALSYLLAAAEQASRGWAKREAATFYGEALQLVPAEDAARRRTILLKQAVAIQAADHVVDVEGRRGPAEHAAPA